MHQQSLTIGQLAAETGLTVRTLRHFEDKGLLGRVARSGAGQRRYGRHEVERLYQVIALRAFGLPLAQIAAVLDSPPTLGQALADQLTRVDGQIAALSSLRTALQRATNNGNEPVSTEELLKMVRQTTVSQDLLNEYLDESEQAVLADQAAHLGEEATRIVHDEYPQLYRRAQEQLDLGTPPDAPPMQEIAGQLEQLSGRLTGDVAGPGEKVQRMWQERSKDITGHDWTDLGEYVMVARRHYRTATRPST
jgi:DNA-binding transcriptional MerR regulator